MDSGLFILPSISNARELGGYVLPDGSRIRKGLLLRGGALSDASDEDIAGLSARYGVRRIFDFRTLEEVTAAPDREVPGADRIWLPAIDPDTEKAASSTLPKEAFSDLASWLLRNSGDTFVQRVAASLYSEMVMNEYTQLQYAAFMSEIAGAPDGAVYWHCSQGKDRTGLGAAFILSALGADRELIMYDYMISAQYYENELQALFRKVQTDAQKEVIRTFISVNPRYFVNALDLIDRRFGSLTEYLKGPLCVTDYDISVLKERYLERD